MCDFCEKIYPDEDTRDIVFGRGKYSNINSEDKPFITVDDEGCYHINVNPGDPYEIGVVFNIKYCPYCGRNLAESKKVIKMRDATPEEREAIDKYIKSISKPIGVNFGTLMQDPKTEPKFCDRNICIQNEYNGIGCDECEIRKSGKE